MRLLYVEDNPRDADLAMRKLLRAAPDLQLETVTTIDDALARLERLGTEPLDMVLTDVRLPDGNGLELLAHIRDSALPLAVVVITGTGDEETAVAALRAGADDYVTKRKGYLEHLHLTLESALHRYRAKAMRHARPLRVICAGLDASDADSACLHFGRQAGHIHLEMLPAGPEALQRFLAEGGQNYDALLLTYRPPGLAPLELLKEMRLKQVDVPVVLVIEPGGEEVALQAIKLGASGYVVRHPGYLYQLPGELEDAIFRAESARREKALRESEERNRAILTAIPDLMFLQTRDGVYLDYHAKEPGLLLISPERFLGKAMKDILPSEVTAALDDCFERALCTGEMQSCEYALMLAGETRWFEARIVLCNGDNLLSVVRDITERKQAEEELLRLTVRLFTLQDEERRRIARELHDGTAQNLFAITINQAKLRRHRSIQDPEVKRILDDCQELCEQALKEIRTLSYLLHPPLLDQAGLASALGWYVDGFSERSGITVELRAGEEIGRLPSEIETALFRVVQESLTNIRRHSGSSTASIRLDKLESEIILQVKDQGRGIVATKVSESAEEISELGVGIPGMRERLRQLGGQLRVESTRQGTTVTAVVPLTREGKNGSYLTG